jgi:type IV secretion system protein VirD4
MNTARNWWVTPFLAILAAVIVANLACQAVASALTALACGTSAEPSGFFSGLAFAFTGSPTAYTTAPGCTFPTTAVRVVDIVVLILVVVVTIIVAALTMRYQQSDIHFMRDVRIRSGFAKWGEVSTHLSSRAILKRSKIIRPNLLHPRATDVGWGVGRSANMDVFVSIEDSMVLEVAPRSGTGDRILISVMEKWTGPLITTSTTHRNLAATMNARARRGTVTVFDPQRLSGVASGARISPIRGCEDPLVADRRAQAIVAGTALGAGQSNQDRAGVVSSTLARLLHAAAVSGGSTEQLYRWGSNASLAAPAVEILRRDGMPGWSDELESVLSGDPKVAAENWLGVAGAVRPLAIPSIRDALSPAAHERFDPLEFLAGENTLYLIGTGVGAGASGGFLGAVIDDVVETARRSALAAPGGKLERPLGLVLDEIANMFSWTALPRIMAEGGSQGISTLVVLHALSQAEAAWSKAEADTVWSLAAAKVLLGGTSNVAHLRDIEAILGTRRIRHSSATYSRTGASTSEQYERVPVMRVDEIRRMPDTMGLLAYHNRRGVLLDLRRWSASARSSSGVVEQRDLKRDLTTERHHKLEQENRLAEQFQRTAAALRRESPSTDTEATATEDSDGQRTTTDRGQ